MEEEEAEDLKTSGNVQLHLYLASSGETEGGDGWQLRWEVTGEGNWIMEEMAISNNENCLVEGGTIMEELGKTENH